MLALDPILGQMPSRKTIHSGPLRNVPGVNPVDHPLFSVGATIEMHMGHLRDGDVGSFLCSVLEFCKEFSDQQQHHMVRILTDVTEAVGNVLSVEGRPITAEDLIRLEESISVRFDEDGKPNQISIMCGSEAARKLQEVTWTAEQHQRLLAMRANKKEEYLASKRTRRLYRSSDRTRA